LPEGYCAPGKPLGIGGSPLGSVVGIPDGIGNGNGDEAEGAGAVVVGCGAGAGNGAGAG